MFGGEPFLRGAIALTSVGMTATKHLVAQAVVLRSAIWNDMIDFHVSAFGGFKRADRLIIGVWASIFLLNHDLEKANKAFREAEILNRGLLSNEQIQAIPYLNQLVQ